MAKPDSNSESESGFIRAGIEIKSRLIVCSQGIQKCGKSHWYLTGPTPIAVIDIDDGISRAIGRFQHSKEIYVARYRRGFTELRNGGSAQTVSKAADEQLDRMRTDYIQALKEARTVAVDGTAELYETIRLACFGRTEKVMERDYGPVNREMKLWVDLARNSDANVVFTHRMKREYQYIKETKKSEPTGEMVLEGWSKMFYECDMVIQHWKEDSEPIPDRYHTTVISCGMNPELDGMDFSGVSADFPTIAQLVFPETGEKDWR
jgi:AAA domain